MLLAMTIFLTLSLPLLCCAFAVSRSLVVLRIRHFAQRTCQIC